MSYETLLYQVDDGVALITINRPKVLNALNRQVIQELGTAMARARDDAAVKVVVLTGAGEKAFAAGADIGEMTTLDPVGAIQLARRGQALTRDMERMGKPIIAAINGFALGGGCEIAMACTLRVASDAAKLGQPEVNLGLPPGYGGTQRLPRLVGKGRAMDLILTGRMVSAEEAHTMGLVTMVVPGPELMDAVGKLAGTLKKKAPLALRYCMEAVNGGIEMALDEGLNLEAHQFGLCAGTGDMKEGLTAFVEKRKPVFKGK